jgi:hypothetical protein
MIKVFRFALALLLSLCSIACAQGDFYSAPYLCSLNPDGTVTIVIYETVPVGAVTIPSTIEGFVVTGLGQTAFEGLSAVTSIALPSSITDIYPGAFSWASYNGSVLAEITVASNNLAFESVDGVLYTKPPTELFAFPPDYPATSFAGPEGVTTLGNAAFQAAAILSVTLSDTLTSIQDACFASCTNLTEISFPPSLTSIGAAFVGAGLTQITIPDTVTNLAGSAFASCAALTNVTIGSGVTSIGGYTFSQSGLTSITFPDTVRSIGSYACWYSRNLAAVSIGEGDDQYRPATVRFLSQPGGDPGHSVQSRLLQPARSAL